MTSTHASAPAATIPSIATLIATPEQRAAARTARAPYRTITVSAAAREGLVPRRMTAEALFAWLPADGTAVPMWDRIGYAGAAEVEYGVSHFRRYSCDTTGTSGAEIVREDGTPVVRYPMGQGRYVRTLGRAA